MFHFTFSLYMQKNEAHSHTTLHDAKAPAKATAKLGGQEKLTAPVRRIVAKSNRKSCRYNISMSRKKAVSRYSIQDTHKMSDR
jgi:hypothetical protein